MKKCWQCSRDVPDEARRCDSCGADLSKYHDPNNLAASARPSGCIKIGVIALAVFVGLAILGAIVGPPPANKTATATSPTATAPASESASNASAPAPAASAPTEPAEPPSEWQYSENRDEMRGSSERFASVTSENELHFGFPYGDTRARLELRQSARFGFDIMVSVESGQFTCYSFSGGRIAVKFDDGPIRNYGCNRPSDGSTEIIFIENQQQFLSQLRRARRVVIEAEFFREGRQQLIFNVAGLNWGTNASRTNR